MKMIWKMIRPGAASVVRRALFRPIGLKRMGERAMVWLPRRISGEEYIEIGNRSYVRSYSTIWALSSYEGGIYRPSIVIGDDVYIGRFVYLAAIDGISVGSGSVLSEHVYVSDHSHGFDPNAGLIMKQRLVSKGPVKIGANCFLGYRAAIMPGVVLGDHCVVGANSVVTRSFPAYSMIGGGPARLLKRYCFGSKTWQQVGDS